MMKMNLFPFFWVEQKVAWVEHYLMELLVPGRERRHLQRQTNCYSIQNYNSSESKNKEINAINFC